MFNFSFEGKADRQEYWKVYIYWFAVLFFSSITAMIDAFGSINELNFSKNLILTQLGFFAIILCIIFLLGFVAGLAVTFRRCSDIGINPYWALISLVPYVGLTAIFIFGVIPSKSSKNNRKRYLEYEDDETHNQKPHEFNFTKFSINSKFNGPNELSNDSYKLFLVEKYKISKNDPLNKYVCNDKLFPSVDEALEHAAASEELQQKEITERELLRVQDERKQKIETSEKLRLKKKKADEDELQKQIAWKAGAPKRRKITIISMVVIIFLGLTIFNKEILFNYHKTKPYGDYRSHVIGDEWQPYIRANRVKKWVPPYPEVEFCYEDTCTASFINPTRDKVREISYSICSRDRYNQCPDKVDEFELVYGDRIISKKESDIKFLKLLKQFF